LGQRDTLAGELPPADQRFGLRPLHSDQRALGDLVHAEKAQIVRRPRIFRTGITQAHNQPHWRARSTAIGHARGTSRVSAGYFLAFSFSSAAGAAATSS